MELQLESMKLLRREASEECDDACIEISSRRNYSILDTQSEDQLLLHGEFLHGRKNRVRLCLTEKEFSWSSTKLKGHVLLKEMVGVTYKASKEGCCFGRNVHQLCVHGFERNRKRKSVWKPAQYRFTSTDKNTVQQWIQATQKLLAEIKERPKHLWVFVNPYGGSKKALKTWKHKVWHLIEA